MSLLAIAIAFIAVTVLYIVTILTPTLSAIRSLLEKVTALVLSFVVSCVLLVVAGSCSTFVRCIVFFTRLARSGVVYIVSGRINVALYASSALGLGVAGVKCVEPAAGSWFAKCGPEITDRLSSFYCSIRPYMPPAETLYGALAGLLYGLLLVMPVIVGMLLAFDRATVRPQQKEPLPEAREAREPKKELKHPASRVVNSVATQFRPGRRAMPMARERQKLQYEERMAQGFLSLLNGVSNSPNAETTRSDTSRVVTDAQSSAVTAPLHALSEADDLIQCTSTSRANNLGTGAPRVINVQSKTETTSPSDDPVRTGLTISTWPVLQLDQVSSGSSISATLNEDQPGALCGSNCPTSTNHTPWYPTTADGEDIGQDEVAPIETRESNCPPTAGTKEQARAPEQPPYSPPNRSGVKESDSNCSTSTDPETVPIPSAQSPRLRCESKCPPTAACKDSSEELQHTGQIEPASVPEAGIAICVSKCPANAEEKTTASPAAEQPSTLYEQKPDQDCASKCSPSTNTVVESSCGADRPQVLAALVGKRIVQDSSRGPVFSRRKKAMSIARLGGHVPSKRVARGLASASSACGSRTTPLDREMDALAVLMGMTSLEDHNTRTTGECPDLEMCVLDSMDIDETDVDSGPRTPMDGHMRSHAYLDNRSWNAMDLDVEDWNLEEVNGDALMTENSMVAEPVPMFYGTMDWASADHVGEAMVVLDTSMTDLASKQLDSKRIRSRGKDMVEPAAFNAQVEATREIPEARVIKSLPKSRLKRPGP